MKRPLAIAIPGWLFIITGALGFVFHLNEFDFSDPLANDAVWILLVRLLAVVGVLILRGVGLGRWLLIAWMAYHVVLSYFHTTSELIIHLLFLALLMVILFGQKAEAYFRRS